MARQFDEKERLSQSPRKQATARPAMRWDNAREQLKEGVRRMAAAATISAGAKGKNSENLG